ncbi:MAG: DapH/DapD/GlmU-related protein [Candidatus Omnitrophica bacterium]|nr:DapH/DapD/GlmU-related protein [Candidatus Omnitrophota bacterium]
MKWLWITIIQLIFAVFIYVMWAFFFGIALMPVLFLLFKVWQITSMFPLWQRVSLLSMTLAVGYFLFGLTLIFTIGIFRTVFRLRLKEGMYSMYSIEALKWAFLSSLYLTIHYTFMDFVLVTPFANLLFRMLGAKLGKNVQFNSKFIFDASLLEIGDNTVVGGGAIIDCHMVERGKLKLKKVKIGKNVTLGSHSTIMPGCEIGDSAIISASAVLQKDTKVERRDIWYGIPAESMRQKVRKDKEDMDKNP